MRGRSVRTLLAASILLAVLVPVRTGHAADFPGFFADVPPDHPAFAAANALYMLGVSQGDGEGRFHPDTPITRAELIRLVLLARGITIPDACTGQFADVPCDAWYAPAVELGYRLAIIDGRQDGWFAPGDPVTREELYTILVRASGDFMRARRLGWMAVRDNLARYADGDAVSPWARPSAAWLAGLGALPGEELLRPGDPATRADVAVLLYHTLAASYPDRTEAQVDGHLLRYAEEREMMATMYTAGEAGVGTMTASGTRVRVGIVATDPDVIPLGTFLYVEGYGYAVAADTGGAIKGNRIDLYTENYHEAVHLFGRKTVRVFVLA